MGERDASLDIVSFARDACRRLLVDGPLPAVLNRQHRANVRGHLHAIGRKPARPARAPADRLHLGGLVGIDAAGDTRTRDTPEAPGSSPHLCGTLGTRAAIEFGGSSFPSVLWPRDDAFAAGARSSIGMRRRSFRAKCTGRQHGLAESRSWRPDSNT